MNRLEHVIKDNIQARIPDAEVHVAEQQGKYLVTVIARQFEGLAALARQKMVYAPLTPHIAKGDIHAVTIKAFTPAEWTDS